MFDVGFFELLLIFVIGLLVLGPERLPRVAAKIGNWIGRARRMTRNLRYQLEDELALQERQAQAKKFISEIDNEIRGDTAPAKTLPSSPPVADVVDEATPVTAAGNDKDS